LIAVFLPGHFLPDQSGNLGELFRQRGYTVKRVSFDGEEIEEEAMDWTKMQRQKGHRNECRQANAKIKQNQMDVFLFILLALAATLIVFGIIFLFGFFHFYKRRQRSNNAVGVGIEDGDDDEGLGKMGHLQYPISMRNLEEKIEASAGDELTALEEIV
jgi:hypothetical protein